MKNKSLSKWVVIGAFCSVAFSLSGQAMAAPDGQHKSYCSALQRIPIEAKEYSAVLAGCIMEMEQMHEQPALTRKSAVQEWEACLSEMVESFDDKISPASDIATALQDECQNQYNAMVRVSYHSDNERAKAYRSRISMTKTRVTRLVLASRSENRKKPYPKW